MGQVVEFPRLAGPSPFDHDPLSPVVTAADATLTALGEDGAVSALSALSGAALTARELEAVRPFADALAWLLDLHVPEHPLSLRCPRCDQRFRPGDVHHHLRSGDES